MTAFEPEGELIQVGLQVLGGASEVVGTGQPALEQARHSVYPRQQFVSRQAGALDVERLVSERARNRVRVGLQGVADDDRAWAEVAVHELPEMRGIDLLHHLQSASAEALRLGLDRDRDIDLPGGSAATLAAGLDPADEVSSTSTLPDSRSVEVRPIAVRSLWHIPHAV